MRDRDRFDTVGFLVTAILVIAVLNALRAAVPGGELSDY